MAASQKESRKDRKERRKDVERDKWVRRLEEQSTRYNALIGKRVVIWGGGLVLLLFFLMYYFQIGFLGLVPPSSDNLGYKGSSHVMSEYNTTHDDQALWNSNIFSGMPGYMIEFGNRIPFINEIRFLIDPLLDWRVLYFIFGALGMYILLLRLKMDPFIALIGAFAFSLSSHLPGLIEIGHHTKFRSIMYIPWIFMSFHHLWRTRSLVGAGLLAIFLIAQFRESHPQIVYYTFILMGLFWAFGLFWALRDKKLKQFSIFTLLFIAVIVITALAVAQPYMSIREYTQYTIRGEGGLDRGYAESWSFHPLEIITFFVPRFFGGVSPWYWGWMPSTGASLYMGIVVMILALIAVFKNRNRLTLFLGVASIIAIIMSFGRHFSALSGFLLAYLPYYNKFRVPATILVILEFTIVLLACLGIRTILQARDADNRKFQIWIKRFLIVSIVLSAIFFLMYPVWQDMRFLKESEARQLEQIEAQINQELTPETLVQLQLPQESRQYLQGVLQRQSDNYHNLMNDALLSSVLVIATLAIILLFMKATIGKVVFLSLLVVFTAGDLLIANRGNLNDLVEPSEHVQVLNEYPIDTFLKEDKLNQDEVFRILPVYHRDSSSGLVLGGFDANRWVYHHQSVGGYHPSKLKRYQEVIERYIVRPSEFLRDPSARQGYISPGVIDMLNTKYTIYPVDWMDRTSPVRNYLGLTEVHRRSGGMDKVDAFLNNRYLPRAWFVDRVVQIPDAQAILDTLGHPSFDPAVIAYTETGVSPVESTPNRVIRLLEKDFDPQNPGESFDLQQVAARLKGEEIVEPVQPQIPDSLSAPADSSMIETWKVNPLFSVLPDPEDHKKIGSAYDLHHLKYYVETDKPSFLVLSEIWYPAGWKAFLDGQEIPIHATNYILRGVEVPPGRHILEVKFQPETYALSVRLSLIGIIAAILMTGVGLFLAYRRKHSGRIIFTVKDPDV